LLASTTGKRRFMACEMTFKFSRQARQNLLASAFSVPHFGQYITRPHMKTPAQPEAVRVKTFMAVRPDYLDSSVPT